eukprot:2883771-Prymnesium_polylepis.1
MIIPTVPFDPHGPPRSPMVPHGPRSDPQRPQRPQPSPQPSPSVPGRPSVRLPAAFSPTARNWHGVKCWSLQQGFVQLHKIIYGLCNRDCPTSQNHPHTHGTVDAQLKPSPVELGVMSRKGRQRRRTQRNDWFF